MEDVPEDIQKTTEILNQLYTLGVEEMQLYIKRDQEQTATYDDRINQIIKQQHQLYKSLENL